MEKVINIGEGGLGRGRHVEISTRGGKDGTNRIQGRRRKDTRWEED